MFAAANTPAHATLPVADLARARAFYEGVLGFTPRFETPAGVMYDAGSETRFFIFPTAGRPSGAHTQMGLTVPDIEAAVAALREKGVVFESYDFPGFDRDTQIASFAVNRSAWFKDPEGNLIGVVQFLRA